SHNSQPTSPSHRSPVLRSNENFHGLRNPNAQISGRTSGRPTNGLSLGTAYALPASSWSTSIRSTLDSRSEQSCPVFRGSGGFGSAESPVDRYRYPSGPKATQPPLCPPA